MPRKKTLLLLPFTAAFLLTLATGFLWINNIVSASRSYAQLFAGGDILNPAVGLVSWLQWSALDVSTISTFIPFFGCFCVLIGVIRLARCRFVSDDFPFYASYDRLNVSLGLIGTVWGIILIGFMPAEQINVASLMSCLHTALFSTLVAVVWVTVLLPVTFRPVMQFLARQVLGEKATENGSLLDIVDQLGAAAAGAGKQFSGGADQLKRFSATLQSTTQSLNDLPRNLDVLLSKMETVLTAVNEVQARQNELLARNTELLETIASTQEVSQKRNSDSVERLTIIQQEFQEQNLAMIKQLQEQQEQLFNRCFATTEKISNAQSGFIEEYEAISRTNRELYKQLTASAKEQHKNSSTEE